MSDDLKHTGPPDTYFVALTQPWEVADIAKKHGVDKEYVEACAIVLRTRSRRLIEELIESNKPNPVNYLGILANHGIKSPPVPNALRGMISSSIDKGILRERSISDLVLPK